MSYSVEYIIPPLAERQRLIKRAQSYGLNCREENSGLLLWWPDEDIRQLIPLVWTGPDGVEYWLDVYGEEGVKQRGITPKTRKRSHAPSPDQLSLFEVAV